MDHLEAIKPGRMRWWVLSMCVLLVILTLAVVRLRSLPSTSTTRPTTTPRVGSCVTIHPGPDPAAQDCPPTATGN